ncbi:MAG: twin-arginine translocation signal domain-containing protein [Actinomycetia bacterium]|nr:twin-arginine translocation signal domain-containing protein [Actinomycetes bacterium]
MTGPEITEPAAPLRFADLPVADRDAVQARLRPRPTRRGVLKGALVGGIGAALAAFGAINLGASRAEAAYFQDWTNHTTGPCAPGGYASGHTEAGLKCGNSAMCLDLSCCWKYRHGTGNLVGWHKNGPGRSGYFLFRPDECWMGTYDSWRWKFSDGVVYRCSDGFTCSPSGSCFRSICPWPT